MAKVVILGDSSVGKSTICSQLERSEFVEVKPTVIGSSFQIKRELDQKSFTLWDTAGQEAYRSLAPMYIRGAFLALLTYDCSKSDTFEQLNGWYSAAENVDNQQKYIVVGNKSDLKGKYPYIQNSIIEEFLKKPKILSHIEISAKTGKSIDILLNQIFLELENSGKSDDLEVPLEFDGTPKAEGGGSSCC